MNHIELIEYDINVLIKTENFMEDFINFIHNLSDFSLSLKEEFIIDFTIDDISVEWDAKILYLERWDIGSFMIILRRYDYDHVNMRFALSLDSDLKSSDIDIVVYSFLVIVFASFENIDCITTGEDTVPYFLTEIRQSKISWDFLYLDRSFIKNDNELFDKKCFIFVQGLIFSLKDSKLCFGDILLD